MVYPRGLSKDQILQVLEEASIPSDSESETETYSDDEEPGMFRCGAIQLCTFENGNIYLVIFLG